jgi:hypothetical protein
MAGLLEAECSRLSGVTWVVFHCLSFFGGSPGPSDDCLLLEQPPLLSDCVEACRYHTSAEISN